MSKRDGHDQPCYYCAEKCDRLAGDPSLWPIGLCHPDEPGVTKWHHEGCVSERLIDLTAARAEIDAAKAAIEDEKNAHVEALFLLAEARAEIERLKAERQWRPIGTAPKDGQAVLLLSAHQTIDAGPNGIWEHPPRAHIGRWNPNGDSWTDEYGRLPNHPHHTEICTLSVTGIWESGGGWFQPNEVTHWMPLPAVPASQEP